MGVFSASKCRFKFACIIFCFFTSVWADILFQDAVLFSLNKRIYFLSDVIKQTREIKNLACGLPDSYLLRLSKLKNVNFPKLTLENFQGYSDYLTNFTTFVRLVLFSKAQGLPDLKKVRGLLEGQINSKNCDAGIKDEFLLAEFYLRDRFQLESIWISRGELVRYSSFSYRDQGQVKNILKAKKLKIQEDQFLRSLQKKIPHEFYWY